jgi:hypothetical protein
MAKELRDDWAETSPAATVNGFERPPRVEDLIPRHANPNDRRPKIWLPDGIGMDYYSRPSGWGKKVEDTKNLSLWDGRQFVSGFLDFGHQSRALRLERAALGPSEESAESKRAHNDINQRAKALVESAARVGTALHTITERQDLGLPVTPPDEFLPHLEEWKRLTRNFEIVTLANGKPGVEVFVVFDQLRPGRDGTGKHDWVRLAGTFDRLWRYKPCEVLDAFGRKCGRRNYIGDLKTGKSTSLQYNGASYGVQEAIYAAGEQYVPWPDGKGADRFPMDDVCPHRAITLSIPSDTGVGETIWTNIAAGFETAVTLIPDALDHRRRKDWFAPFEPTLDPWTAIDRAGTLKELDAVWPAFPDMTLWRADESALANYAKQKKSALTNGAF